MSGGQDEASERINTSDLPYWLAGPIKRLEARVQRLERYDPELLLAKIACLEQESEDRRQQRLTPEQRNAMLDDPKPAKRREWWGLVFADGSMSGYLTEQEADADAAKAIAFDPVAHEAVKKIRVIAAPSEAEIEEAVDAGWNEWRKFQGRTVDDAIRAAIRKLLGGTS